MEADQETIEHMAAVRIGEDLRVLEDAAANAGAVLPAVAGLQHQIETGVISSDEVVDELLGLARLAAVTLQTALDRVRGEAAARAWGEVL